MSELMANPRIERQLIVKDHIDEIIAFPSEHA
jgi:hypothetical protein